MMIREARAQGAKPELFSDMMTRACEQLGRGITEMP
jgi:hypothetical protein